jgi:uncharacterized protein YdaU (DUF1376 family)
MAKDPAFLFYPGDWLGGTLTFSRSHKGAYMDLLMVQFNSGHMALQDVQTVLGETDFSKMWEQKLKAKFTEDAQGKFYNEKLENEILKRKNYTNSRRKNLNSEAHKEQHKGTYIKTHMESHMQQHMENENENENENINGSEKPKTDWNKLAPRMLNLHIGKNPGYMTDKKKDFTNLLKIAYFIFEQSGASGSMFEHTDEILQAWGAISEYIAKDKFYAQKGLNTISNNIQELANKAIYGDKAAENKKRGGTGKLNEDTLKKKLDARFGN